VRDSEKPDGDIAITFTGLRPGEKLFEELLLSKSDQPSGHPLIRKAQEHRLEFDELAELLYQLHKALRVWDAQQATAVLQKLVSEYQGFSGGRSSAPNDLKTPTSMSTHL
jgi:FlaA1/EpsC-like NDP-sugar epimerase